MSRPSATPADGHLRYYQQHGISPVKYRMETLGAHFDRRDSLYRSLGLPPVAFRGARVLEVAPGSGQNSLYVAACQPRHFDLVEPNPTGLRDIQASYASFDVPHTEPSLYAEPFESFAATEPYDIVICENWLGSLPHEVDLIRKLAALVAPGGAMVITVVPLSGFFANILRKLLALRLLTPGLSFEEQTDELVEVFGPHLASIPEMTRSHRDWVHDCMMNPHYLNVALPLETAVEAVNGLEILATSPRFTPDWRWFKGLVGESRRFNEAALSAYRDNAHNFVDYRTEYPPRPVEADDQLAAAFAKVHETALAWQAASEKGDDGQCATLDDAIGRDLDIIAKELASVDPELGVAVDEVRQVWQRSVLTSDMVRDMKSFGALFGRETVYVSFTRPMSV